MSMYAESAKSHDIHMQQCCMCISISTDCSSRLFGKSCLLSTQDLTILHHTPWPACSKSVPLDTVAKYTKADLYELFCRGVAAGGKSARSPSGAPETPETTSQAPGGDIRPGYDPTGKDKGQHSAALANVALLTQSRRWRCVAPMSSMIVLCLTVMPWS